MCSLNPLPMGIGQGFKRLTVYTRLLLANCMFRKNSFQLTCMV